MEYVEAAQEALEAMLDAAELHTATAQAQAEGEMLHVNAYDMANEFAEAADEFVMALNQGESWLGLMLVNLRRALAQRRAGVLCAPGALQAARLGRQGLKI